MTPNEWYDTIKNSMIEVGTYKAAFEPIVLTLSRILSERDKTAQDFEKSGEPIVVVYNNGSRATNAWIKTWNDLNSQALKYWHELGLTPAGLKRINESAVKPKKQNSLAELIKELG